jgi:hypothetical protein
MANKNKVKRNKAKANKKRMAGVLLITAQKLNVTVRNSRYIVQVG